MIGSVLAAALVTVVTHVLFIRLGGGGYPFQSVRWATFAFTVPWVILVADRARAPFGLALMAGHALYAGPVLMKSASALLAPVFLGAKASTKLEQFLGTIFTDPLRLRWELLYQGLPLTLFLALLLESRRVPGTAWWLRVLLATASAALGDLLFWHGKIEPGSFWREGVLSSPYLWEHFACVAVTSASLAAKGPLDERLVVWLTGIREERSRRG